MFPKPFYDIKTKRKNVKIKGAKLVEDDQKLEGPKIKRAEN